MTSKGKGVAFGLYTMTGRAVAFVAPWLFFVFVGFFRRPGRTGVLLVVATRAGRNVAGARPRADRPGGRAALHHPVQMVRPRRLRCRIWAPFTETVQVTSRPTLTTATLAEFRAGAETYSAAPRQCDVELRLHATPPVST